MTNNQIKYWEHRESVRHNKAEEAESQRHNAAVETTNQYIALETNRHNVATESNQLFANTETARHNLVNETETQRHNFEVEGLNRYSVEDQARHNLASESIGQQNVALGYANLAETTRSDKAREDETHRANVAGEVIEGVKTGISEQRAAEDARHNREMEDIQRNKGNDRNPYPSGDGNPYPSGSINDGQAYTPVEIIDNTYGNETGVNSWFSLDIPILGTLDFGFSGQKLLK